MAAAEPGALGAAHAECRPGRRRTFECRGGQALRRGPEIPRACTRDCAIRRRAARPRAGAAGTARAARASRLARSGGGTRSPPTASRAPSAVVSATVTVCSVSSRSASSARARSAPAGSQIETSSPTASRLERVVAQDPAREPLVGDHDPLLGERAQDGEVQPHVLDHAVVVLERDPVADAQRLGDREHDPGDEVGQRLAGGEADDRRDERARGEEAAGDAAEPGELRERAEVPATSSTSHTSRRTKRRRVSASWVIPPRSTRPASLRPRAAIQRSNTKASTTKTAKMTRPGSPGAPPPVRSSARRHAAAA